MAKKRSNNPLPPVSEQLKNTDENGPEIIIYQTRDGATKVDVQLVDETVWLTQDQMAQLFQKAKSTINEHIKNIFEEGELEEELVMRKFGNSEFSTKPTNFSNLPNSRPYNENPCTRGRS